MSSINRVLRNIAASKEQTSQSHHLSSAVSAAATADSVYDKLRMFNGQAAAASWAWYGAAASASAASAANPAAAAAAAATSPHLAGLAASAAGGGVGVGNGGVPGAPGGGGGHNAAGLGSHHFASADGHDRGHSQDSDEKKPLSGESRPRVSRPCLLDKLAARAELKSQNRSEERTSG